MEGEDYDFSDAPLPAFHLLEIERYNRLTVRTSRGCPHRCEFCAGSLLFSPTYRQKPAAKVLAEIDCILANIQAHGIRVNGCFVLPPDGQGPEIFDAVRAFVREADLFDVQITLLTPFPGAPPTERLRREGPGSRFPAAGARSKIQPGERQWKAREAESS